MSQPRPTSGALCPARCAGLIRAARRAVALTGAGISTAAGLPDFRGPVGLYVSRRYDPEKVFEIGWFRREPRFFYEFSRDFVAVAEKIRPSFTHRFLARLEEEGRLTGVITQNIDILHQLAGSRTVVELHGSYRSATCTACGRRLTGLDPSWWREAMAAGPVPPVAVCRDCGGVLKPDIVFFGEPVRGYEQARALVSGCDLLLVLGSTLSVTPASLLPAETRAPTVIVNRGGTALPAAPHRHFVAEPLEDYFRKVARHLGTPAERDD